MPTWWEHVDLMEIAIVLLFGAFIWFCIRTLQGIDTNQREMFKRLTSLERDFYVLRGEHNARLHRSGNDVCNK
jgi:hypothetical protein